MYGKEESLLDGVEKRLALSVHGPYCFDKPLSVVGSVTQHAHHAAVERNHAYVRHAFLFLF